MLVATEPRWVSVEAVIAFNKEIVEASSEPHELHDATTLRTAVAHPWNVWVYFMDPDLAVLAMRLYTSLVNARAFAAGNEPTAFRAAEAFLEANGYQLDLGDNRPRAIERLNEFAAGRLSQAGVVEWFRLWMTPRR